MTAGDGAANREIGDSRVPRSRRKILAISIALVALAGCSGSFANAPVWVAFQRELSGDVYAIELPRGFAIPVAAADAFVFKQLAPVEWDRVRDQAVINQVLADFNANRARWQDLSPSERDLLWLPRPEPPEM
jgi:hypothetical protein